MIGLVQRVTSAQVSVQGSTIGAINQGILLFLGIEKTDTELHAEKLLHKIINYRIFEDDHGKMNLSLKDIDGELMVISQFTLPADTHKGMRPSFTPAADATTGKQLYEYFVYRASHQLKTVETGEFGRDMHVSLTNDGPVTFWLQISEPVK